MARGGFRGGYGGMNQANVMKQAQKMQQDFLRMQKELEEKEFTAKSGGGMVSATVNGNREVTKIEIKPEAVDPDDVEMLEDLVLAAVNEALRQYEAASDATVSKITGGMKLGLNHKNQHALSQDGACFHLRKRRAPRAGRGRAPGQSRRGRAGHRSCRSARGGYRA